MLYSENEQDDSECSICHKSFKLDENNVCENCKEISELGNDLPKIQAGEKVILIKEANIKNSLKIPSIEKNRVLSLVLKRKTNLQDESYIRGYSINSNNIKFKDIININAGIYSKQLENQDSLITFEELADRSIGIKRLGVLRADVDNLGKAFSEGFELNNQLERYKYISLSRNSNLSYNLSQFFKSDINSICKGDFKGEKFKLLEGEQGDRSVAIVYAGGDDLFIVGAWNEIIELAVDINNQFKKFTNDKMTLSAGIGIFNSKYPIDQMASQTGKLEEIAKTYTSDIYKEPKNKICLFDSMPENIGEEKLRYKHIYTWEDFQNGVYNEKMKLMYKWFDFDGNNEKKLTIGMSLLYRMLLLVREIKADKKINLARIVYLIGRLESGEKTEEVYLDFKEQFYKWVLNKKDLQELETALTLIIYLNRKDEINE